MTLSSRPVENTRSLLAQFVYEDDQRIKYKTLVVLYINTGFWGEMLSFHDWSCGTIFQEGTQDLLLQSMNSSSFGVGNRIIE